METQLLSSIKMKSILGHLVLLLMLITGCDPVKYLIVENKHQNPVNQIEITLMDFDVDNQNFQDVFPRHNDSLVVGKRFFPKDDWKLISIKPHEENIFILEFSSSIDSEEIILEFGLGRWTENTLNSFANIIESFCITRQSENMCLKENEEIFKLLMNNLDKRILKFEL